MHAEVKIGDSRVMIADESEMAKATPSSLYLYVPNVDSVYQQAVNGRWQDDHGTDGHVLRRPLRRREGSVRQ